MMRASARGFWIGKAVWCWQKSGRQSQGCCVLNRAFLVPIIKTMRTNKTPISPSLDIIREQIEEELWVSHLAAKKRKTYRAKGREDFPS